MAKHYITVNETIIVDGFSTDFKEPAETDICINEKGGRQFELLEETNPPLINFNNCHLYRYVDGIVRKSTEDELAEELKSIQESTPPEKTDEYDIRTQLAQARAQIQELSDYTEEIFFQLCMLQMNEKEQGGE